MEPATAVLLGALQGISEWLPVSSEAVIALFMTQLMGSAPAESVNAAIFLHTGTMLAALAYFRRDFLGVLEDVPRCTEEFFDKKKIPSEYALLNFLFFSTLASGLVGGAIYLLGMDALPSNPAVFTGFIGFALVLTGIIKLIGKPATRGYADINLLDSFEVGFLQGLAVIPGISRSGATVFGLFALDFDSDDAFRLSFLMSVPAVLVAQIGLNLFSGFEFSPMLLLAAATSFVVGYLSIDIVLKIAERIEVAYLCFLLALLSFASILI